MQATSDVYFDGIVAGVREIKAKVEITWTDPREDSTVSVSSNDLNRVSAPWQTINNSITPTFNWFSLGSSKLDGISRLMPDMESIDDYEVGWWSKSASNDSNVFLTPPELNLELGGRALRKLTVTGDSLKLEYPVDFEIKVYNGNTLLYTKTVTGNNSVNWEFDVSQMGINLATKMVLRITKWNKPNCCAKILEFFSSIKMTYDSHDIVSINIVEESETQGGLPFGSISANELSLKLNNIDSIHSPSNRNSPLYGLIKKNRKIKVWIGLKYETYTEWRQMGVFWSGDWKASSNSVYVETTCRDLLQLMTETDFKTEIIENTNLYNLAELVLNDYGLSSDMYKIDTSLQQFIIPYAWFDKTTHREALRQIAEASVSRVYADREGKIRIEKFKEV